MRIELAVNIGRRFHTSLREAREREIGGMLLAEQLKPGHFCIIDFSVDSFSGSHTGFRRDPQAHQNALDEFFRRTGRDFQRFNYLGEWHSHPSFSVHPSTQDINTMTEIVENQSSLITFAVLLIVRLRFRIWVEHSLTVFARDQAPQPSRISRRVVWI
jgi:integrative and conjugative element protein (TIGR02256 family)